jgi:hypothetical protein
MELETEDARVTIPVSNAVTGREIQADTVKVSDNPLFWEVKGRSGYTAGFAYRADERARLPASGIK